MKTAIATPGSRGGAASLSAIKSGPTVQQPFVSGHRIAKGKTIVAPSFAKKTSDPRVKSHGSSKMAAGGEKETSFPLTRTNLGRQRL
jgi:hypothetical protein